MCIDADIRMNHLSVLSAGAWTVPTLGRTVHDLAAGVTPFLRASSRSAMAQDLLLRRNLNLASREDPVREERFKACLGVSRPPKTPLDNVEPQREVKK
jgi:hypothetical protein